MESLTCTIGGTHGTEHVNNFYDLFILSEEEEKKFLSHVRKTSEIDFLMKLGSFFMYKMSTNLSLF